ncbi:MAG: sulfite exporter TauE/SafE family protein [Anaerolineae bacterium]
MTDLALKGLLVLVIGAVAGWINVFAGGGSLLTLPLLIFLGLPSAVANGTNRVAVAAQNVFAVMGFRSKGVSDLRLSVLFSVPAVIGSIAGARIALDLPDALFRRVLAIVMVAVLIIVLWNPAKRMQKVDRELTPWRAVIAVVGFFLIGMYGGFLQAGVGFLIIAFIVFLTGFDLVRTNALKVFIIGLLTVMALVMFAMEGKVDWPLGIALGIGNSLGGWFGSRFQVEKGEKVVRIMLIVAVLIMALQLSGVVHIPGWR